MKRYAIKKISCYLKNYKWWQDRAFNDVLPDEEVFVSYNLNEALKEFDSLYNEDCVNESENKVEQYVLEEWNSKTDRIDNIKESILDIDYITDILAKKLQEESIKENYIVLRKEDDFLERFVNNSFYYSLEDEILDKLISMTFDKINVVENEILVAIESKIAKKINESDIETLEDLNDFESEYGLDDMNDVYKDIIEDGNEVNIIAYNIDGYNNHHLYIEFKIPNYEEVKDMDISEFNKNAKIKLIEVWTD